MNNHQPNWSKLSNNLSKLIEKPWEFGLFKAFKVLEDEWAINDEMEKGLSNRVLITPNKELGFPASDVYRGQLVNEGRGTFHIQANYSGLYGADAAMPHYLIEQAAIDGEEGERTRAFLDIFNHPYYCFLYQAWKKSQLTIDGLGAKQFDQMMNGILSSRQIVAKNGGVAVIKTASACGLAKLLNDEFNSTQIKVDDTSPHWQEVGRASRIGENSTVTLGESLILGDKVLVSGGKVRIELGRVTEVEAKRFFPGGLYAQKLMNIVQSQISADLPWECDMLIDHDYKPIQKLGDEGLLLGTHSHIGEVLKVTKRQQFKDSQYSKRTTPVN